MIKKDLGPLGFADNHSKYIVGYPVFKVSLKKSRQIFYLSVRDVNSP